MEWGGGNGVREGSRGGRGAVLMGKIAEVEMEGGTTWE